MRELLGQVGALDPQVSETLAVVAYFDALVEGGAGTRSMLRAAAALSGTTCFFVPRDGGSPVCMSPDGRTERREPLPGCDVQDSTGWKVGLERTGPPHVNDKMVVERLAMSVSIALSRSPGVTARQSALELLLGTGASAVARAAGVEALNLRTDVGVRALAQHSASGATRSRLSVVVVTSRGLVRGSIVQANDVPELRGAMGVGVSVLPLDADVSWSTAVSALWMSSSDEPVIAADSMGALALANSPTSFDRHPDVVAIAHLAADSEDIRVLDALFATSGIREAARTLGLHHSTVQARLPRLSAYLGYDPTGPEGRYRYGTARALHRLS